jgi:ComF family protein
LSKYSFSCTALYDYTSEVRSALIRFKFQDETILKEYFGEKLSERMRKISFKPDIVTSVPISKKRKRRRGYNQSELLARELSKNLEVPYQELLFKVRDNVPQHELSEQDRLENVKGVYCTKNDKQVLGKKILLVDDILTTGATMCSAAQTLFCAGAKDVFGIAVATTPVSR